jgi:hypothetical protein
MNEWEPANGQTNLKRTRVARWISTGLAASLVALLGLYLWTRLPVVVPREVSGEARCSSGEQVQGVWVKVVIGDQTTSGFADLRPPTATRDAAAFSRTVKGTRYVLHVGCGGTRRQWELQAYSPTLEVSQTRLVCFDRSTDARYETCEVVSPP